MVAGTSGVSNITTGTATSGDTSNWAMKVEAVDGTGASGDHVSYTPTILSPFNDFTGVPDAWAKVAEVTSVNGKTNGAAIDASYAIYVAPKQPSATYTGKVRYTVVHPASVDPSAGQANLDTGQNINLKLKSLAYGTNITNYEDSNDNIAVFVRSDTLPANFTPSDANTISLSNSLTPVYVWYGGSGGTMYYYSKAKDIYMHNDSSNLFNYMEYLVDISGLKYFRTNNVTNMNNMFRYTKISDLTPLANWNVGSATNMNHMFYFTQISDLTPIANWNVDNVTNMGGIFAGTQISDLMPIKDWKVDNVTNMSAMFYLAFQISDLTPIANWKVDNVTDMGHMFQSTTISDLTPIANWNVGNVTSMVYMFYGVYSTLTDGSPISKWDVNRVTGVGTTSCGEAHWSGSTNCFYRMFGTGGAMVNNPPIFTSRPGTWYADGTYITN